MRSLALGLVTSLALTGCAKEESTSTQPAQILAPMERLDTSRAAFAVDLLAVEAFGAEQRGDVLNARDFSEARAIAAYPFSQVELGGAVFSVIHNAHTGVVTLVHDGGGNLGTPFCYAFEGDPETPVVASDEGGSKCR